MVLIWGLRFSSSSQSVGRIHFPVVVGWTFSCLLSAGDHSQECPLGWLCVCVCVCVCAHVCTLSCFSSVWLFATLWIVAHQAPLSMGFSRQECWSGLPFSFSSASSLPRVRTLISYISCIGRRVLCHWCHLGWLSFPWHPHSLSSDYGPGPQEIEASELLSNDRVRPTPK